MSTASEPRRARFETVAAAVWDPLQRYLRRRAAAADADDVFAEVLTVLWRRLDDVPRDDPLPFAYGVGRRCLANHRRGDERRLRLVDRAVAHHREPSPADPAEIATAGDPRIAEAIDRLTPAEAEIVRLWAWEQLEPREIAVVLDITANAASVALSRAKRKLAAELGRQDPPPAGHSSSDGTTGATERSER